MNTTKVWNSVQVVKHPRLMFVSLTTLGTFTMCAHLVVTATRMGTNKGLKPGRASPEQLKARLERRRSNAAGPHLNKGLRDSADWRKDVDDELDERFDDG